MTLYIRPSDYRELLKPQGPLFAFIFPWLLVLVGQVAALCDIIIPVYSPFYLLVIGNMISAVVIAFFYQTFFPKKLALNRSSVSQIEIGPRFKRLVLLALKTYVAMQVIQAAYFKGLPLFWLLMKSGKTYANYGIHSLNGLLNAIFLLGTTSLFIIYLKERKRWQLVMLCLMFCFPVLVVSRQLLISLFLQIGCVAIIYSKRALRGLIMAGAFLLCLFVIVGNLRTGLSTIVTILGPKDFIPQALYPLLWIYAYIVTPFNNINAAFEDITPLGYPYHEIKTLIPSLFRNAIGLQGDDAGFSLVHQNMTVSSFYLEPLLDFGPAWAFIFVSLFQILLIGAFRRACTSRLPLHILEYSILYMIAILSIFSNLLLYLPVVAQLLLLNLAKLKLFKRGKNWILAVHSKA